MSGFEIIGVILGVYPIVIDGFKLYKAAKSGQGLTRLQDELSDELIRYTDFLCCLFGENFVTEKQATLKDGNVPLLSLSPRQLKNLEGRLDKAKAKLIVSTLKDMKDVLDSMKLDIDRANAGNVLDVGYYAKVTSAFRTIKFIRQKSSFREGLQQLQKCNYRLRYYLNNQALPRNSISLGNTPLGSKFPRQDLYAVDIYCAIKNGYICDCDSGHPARIALPDLPSSFGIQGLAADSSNSFKLLFPFEELVEIDAAPVMDVQAPLDGSFREAQMEKDYSVPGRSGPVRPKKEEKNRGSLKHPRRLSVESSTATVTTTTTNASSRSSLSKSRSLVLNESLEVDTKPIEDICKMVRDFDTPTPKDQESIGIISSDKKKYELRRSKIVRESSTSGETFDLDDLLNLFQDAMYRSYRFALAFQLSYAVLQFYSTEWIDPKWSWKDFTIVMNGERPHSGDPLFITHEFYSPGRQVSRSRIKTSIAFWAGVGEETLTRLGFALIELGLGRRLSEIRQDGSIQADPRMRMINDTDILDFWTAEGVLDAGLLFHEQCEDFEEVVRLLIKHEFMEGCEKKTLSSRKPSFYGDVERLVISPLYSLWAASWGKHGISRLSY